MAEFPGGIRAWENHLKQYLQQPKGGSIEERVILSFVVLASGKLADISITRGLSAAADQAAIEVLRKSPDWIPRMLNGMAIDSRMAVMIKFEPNH